MADVMIAHVPLVLQRPDTPRHMDVVLPMVGRSSPWLEMASLDLPTPGTLIPVHQETGMVIGEAARASGVSAKMLRYYESIGLIPPAGRTGGGYRTYEPRDVETLRFIRRARDLGLSMERIKLLVGLWHDRHRPSREVKRIALEHVAELRARIGELGAMCATLEELAAACHGDQRPDCPILRDLAAGSRAMPRQAGR